MDGRIHQRKQAPPSHPLPHPSLPPPLPASILRHPRSPLAPLPPPFPVTLMLSFAEWLMRLEGSAGGRKLRAIGWRDRKEHQQCSGKGDGIITSYHVPSHPTICRSEMWVFRSVLLLRHRARHAEAEKDRILDEMVTCLKLMWDFMRDCVQLRCFRQSCRQCRL